MNSVLTILPKVGGFCIIFGILFVMTNMILHIVFHEAWMMEVAKYGFLPLIAGLWLAIPKIIQVMLED